MRLRKGEMPLDPEIQRELEAIDQALAGQKVEPELEELAMLTAEIRGERPAPSPHAEGRLDRLAAEGFPPRPSDRLGRASRRTRDALASLRGQRARRLLPALGAAGVMLIAVGIGLSQSGVFGGGETAGGPPTAVQPQKAPETGRPPAPAQDHPAPEAATTGELRPPDDANTGELRAGLGRVGPGPRKLARNVDLELSTAPDDFRGAADGVLDVVRDHRGFVVSSHVSGGDPDVRGSRRGHASFDLRIPAGELSAAIGDLSDLGHVVSRTDGARDITKRFVSARGRIDALTAARDRLLRQLGQATTIAERQSIRARLRIVEARLAAAHNDLARARERVRLVPVSVSIEADARQGSGGAWSIGDAFHDAGRVLTVTAGGALVGAAALLPFAVLAAVGLGAWRGWVRRQRGRALDAAAG